MTKDEFVANLSGHDIAIAKAGRVVSVLGLAALVLFYLVDWSIRHNYVALPRFLPVLVFLLLMVYWVLQTRSSLKKIEVQFKVCCPKCGARYDQDTLEIAILENKCQACDGEIYET